MSGFYRVYLTPCCTPLQGKKGLEDSFCISEDTLPGMFIALSDMHAPNKLKNSCSNAPGN